MSRHASTATQPCVISCCCFFVLMRLSRLGWAAKGSLRFWFLLRPFCRVSTAAQIKACNITASQLIAQCNAFCFHFYFPQAPPRAPFPHSFPRQYGTEASTPNCDFLKYKYIYMYVYLWKKREACSVCGLERSVCIRIYIYTPCQPSLLSKIEQCHRVLFLFRPARLLGGGCSVVPALRGFPTLLCVCVCNYAGVSVTMGWCVIVHLAWWWLLQRCWSCWSCFVSPFLSIFVFCFVPNVSEASQTTFL